MFLKKFFKFFIILMIFCEIIFYPIKLNAYGLVNINDNISDCKLKTNCIFQTWKVDDSEKAFIELIQILENTPRLKIINKEKNYKINGGKWLTFFPKVKLWQKKIKIVVNKRYEPFNKIK